MQMIIFKFGLWAVFAGIVAAGPILSVSLLATRSRLAVILWVLALVMSCLTYRRIAEGGPEHLRVALVLSAIGFIASAAYTLHRLHA